MDEHKTERDARIETPEQLPHDDPNDVHDPLPEDAGTIALPDVGQGKTPEDTRLLA